MSSHLPPDLIRSTTPLLTVGPLARDAPIGQSLPHYLPELDGVRALAILLVMGMTAMFPYTAGGFI